ALRAGLFLRGAQTRGGLRQRTERLCSFAWLADVEQTLERLVGRELVGGLPRRPGRKEVRYGQLLGGDIEAVPATSVGADEPVPDLAARLAALEERVTELEQRLG